MRKIFVVLLVLAIAGGALAQEAEEAKEGSNWGTLTGEAQIATTVDFYNNDLGHVGIYGGQEGDLFLRMQWEYNKGDWSAYLPFEIEANKFTTDDGDDDTFSGIKFNPDGGPLTVEVPFTVTFSRSGFSGGSAGSGVASFAEAMTELKKTVNTWDAVTQTVSPKPLYAYSKLIAAGLTDSTIEQYYLAGRLNGVIDAIAKGYTTSQNPTATPAPTPLIPAASRLTAAEATAIKNLFASIGGAGSGASTSGVVGPFDMYGQMDATAIYETDDFMFKFGFTNLLGGDGNVAVGPIGGWYDFNGKGRLAVSYQGATDSEWWRASDLVLMATPLFDKYAWENIGGDWSDYGLAYKYNISDELSAGISFAGGRPVKADDPVYGYFGFGQAGEAMFTGTDKKTATTNAKWEFVDDFLTNVIIGMKYDGAVALSLMTGLHNWKSRYYDDDKWTRDLAVPLHIGASWSNDTISVKGDISAAFGNLIYDYDTNPSKEEKDIEAFFNVGVQFQFGDSSATDGFWARLVAKGLDLGDNVNFYSDGRGKIIDKEIEKKAFGYENDFQVFSVDLWLAYQRNVDDDNAGWEKFDGKGDGIWAAVYAGFPDLTSSKFRLNSKFGVGYNNLALTEKLTFGIGATVGLDINPMKSFAGAADNPFNFVAPTPPSRPMVVYSEPDWDKNEIAGSFEINPVLTWNVIEKGSIEFSYTLGTTDFSLGKLDVNKFTTSFKWSL